MMGSVCAEQQNKFHHSHQLYHLTKKSLREIDIPPRKLLGRRSSEGAGALSPSSDVFTLSPKAEDAVFSKFLPYNNVDGEDDSDPYSSDHFRMFEFKVRKCNRSRSHDWTDCPFAHPGEKARRRDPRRFYYSGTVCSEFRKSHCGKGDNCEFSHGVFECWLHPSRYRTEACKDGKNCKRKVCFFAHSTRQLRIVPENSPSPPLDSPKSGAERSYCNNMNRCCVFCHHTMTASPTSTLLGISHGPPPFSPSCSPDFPPGFNGGDRFRLHELGSGVGSSYKDEFSELMSSFEAMNMAKAAAGNGNKIVPWLDVNNFNFDQQQPQFVLSPSTPNPGSGRVGPSKLYRGDFSGRNLMEDSRFNNESSVGGPDLGWVNDLLI